jgi:hypothetical protein
MSVAFLKTEKSVEIYISGPVFDFVEQLPKSTFRASNGFSFYCGDFYSNFFHQNCLYITPNQFRGKRVDLLRINACSDIIEKVDELEFALRELRVQFENSKPVDILKDMKIL